MNRTTLRALSAVVAIAAVGLAVIIPRQEIGHAEPDTLGGGSTTLYDYLIVTRVAVLVVGLAIAGTLYAFSRRHWHRNPGA